MSQSMPTLGDITSVIGKLPQYLSRCKVNSIDINSYEVVYAIDFFGREIRLSAAQQSSDLERYVLSAKLLEVDELQMFLKYLPKNGIFFDIGANMGIYSILAKLFRENVTVHAFEPNPETYTVLINNLQRNSVKVNAVNCGLSNEFGELTLYANRKFPGSSSLRNLEYGGAENVKEVLCRIETLDDYVEDNGIQGIDYIKCDIEGAEKLMLDGGQTSIKRFKPIIQLEMLRKWSAKFGYHPNDIIDLLAPLGYAPYVAAGEQLVPFGRVEEDTLETNYWFIAK